MPKVKLSKRIVERRKGQPKIQQQSKAKRGYSINMDTSEAVKKSPEVEHVVKKKPKCCPESGTVQNFTCHGEL